MRECNVQKRDYNGDMKECEVDRVSKNPKRMKIYTYGILHDGKDRN